ncbi:MAG: calcium/proton exchanger, partial [Ardenticatenaceae bacterium]
IPLAGLLGEATEELAIHTGPRIGGLVNATLGNAAELIITIVALNNGLIELVKASITGSILGNLLLITGAALLLGGLKNGIQTFDRRVTGLAATQMTLAVIALAIPTLFDRAIGDRGNVLTLSEEVGAVMIAIYALYLVYSFTRPTGEPRPETGVDVHEPHEAKWSVPVALGILAGATIAIVFLSEILVGAVELVVEQIGLSEFFLGIILVPLVGNVAEHLVGVTAAYKNQMELSLEISLGSSMQIALFVAPLLVFISLFIGDETMNLVFTDFELIALAAATAIATFVSLDGESNWLEGVQLLAVYLMFGFGFFFL